MPITGPIPLPQSMMDAFLNTMEQSAKTRQERAKANLPFGGANVKGPAGQVLGLQMMKMMYGEDSPEYKQAQDAFNLSQQSVGSRVNYQNALTGNMPLRYTTPEGRQIIEQSNVNQGASPTGSPAGQPVVPGQPGYNPQAATNANGGITPAEHYSLRQAKSDLPSSVMQKNLYANNIEKTLDSIDVDALTKYNGIPGQFKLKQQQALDAAGKPTSDEYKAYKAAATKFNYLPDQRRQFYGSSVQPSAVDRMHSEMDPRGVFESPTTGKLRFKANAEILKKELQTYRNASKSGTVYSGNEPESNIQFNPNPQLAPGVKPPQIKNGGVTKKWKIQDGQLVEDNS